MPGSLIIRLAFSALAITTCFSSVSCSTGPVPTPPKGFDRENKMIVSVSDQKMVLVSDGIPIKAYKVSTSKFGIGDRPGSNRTPLGHMKVVNKIGDRAPLGSVFKNRKRTGEVIKPNSPGRDPIVTRILWLAGTENRNRNAYERGIYIHGTPEEKRLGRPASYGCIRMSSKDVADLYNRVGHGADVFIIAGPLQTDVPSRASAFLRSFGGDPKG